MIYSIIETKKGERHGIIPKLHTLLENGSKMIVNENELRLVNTDISVAATELGGALLTIHDIAKYRIGNK